MVERAGNRRAGRLKDHNAASLHAALDHALRDAVLCSDGDPAFSADDERDPAHGLHGRHHRRKAPARQQVRDLASQAFDPSFGIGHGIDIVLEHNLLRRVREPHRREPATVRDRPALLPGIDAAMPQQETLQMLTRLAQQPHRGRTGPNQVAHRLMRGVRNPDSGQGPRAVQLRQHHGIATVRLHAVARFHGDERGRDHDAVVTQLDKLSIQAVAAWPGCAAEMKPPPVPRQSFDQLANMIGAVRERAPGANLAPTLALRHRNRCRRLVDSQPDEQAILHAVSPPFLRLGASQSDAKPQTENAAGEASDPVSSHRDHAV